MFKLTTPPVCAIIIVTHNSERHLYKAMECISQQTRPPQKIIIVDSGSRSLAYLYRMQAQSDAELVCMEGDIGFCRGNNIGMRSLPPQTDYVFLLNPDAFLPPCFLEKAIAFMEDPANAQCGALTGTLLGYDMDADKPAGTFDSTGIFRTWYGRWYDRDQGKTYEASAARTLEHIPAICGAAFFCRKKAIDQVLIRGSELFDSRFYMYKEDIDLSLRLRRKGWNLAFVPDLHIYHCRGWKRDRSQMPRQLRLISAKNEIRIQARLKEPVPLLYSLLKYTAVKILDM
jgi:N-acetylglucosaminyl-diphospho-decaprenol L-rhamnosyltransferase